MIQPQKRLLQNRQKPLKNIDGYTFITVFIFSKFWFLNSKLFHFFYVKSKITLWNNIWSNLFFFFCLVDRHLRWCLIFSWSRKISVHCPKGFWALKLFFRVRLNKKKVVFVSNNQCYQLSRLWKCQNFSATQIFRVIIFDHCISESTAGFLQFLRLWILTLVKYCP